jgi:hypothetical protein
MRMSMSTTSVRVRQAASTAVGDDVVQFARDAGALLGDGRALALLALARQPRGAVADWSVPTHSSNCPAAARPSATIQSALRRSDSRMPGADMR